MADTSRAGGVPRGAPPTLPCSTCRQPVDPLRATRVAHIGGRFRYFCSTQCRADFVPDPGRTPLPLPRRSRLSPPPDPSPPTDASRRADARRLTAEAIEDVASDGVQRLSSRKLAPVVSAPPPLVESAAASTGLLDLLGPSDVGTLLLSIAVVGGALATALALAGTAPGAVGARLVLVTIAAGAYAAHALSPGRDQVDPHPAALVVAPTLVAAAAVSAHLGGSPETSTIATLAGLVVTTAAASAWLIDWAKRPLDAEREHIARALDGSGHRVSGNEVVGTHARELRAGEEIVVEPGDLVPVDATVVAGSARVHPWLDATTTAGVGEGDTVVAGATVIEGRLRAVASWSAGDRAWMRLTNDPLRRADVHAPLARIGRHLGERGAPIFAGLAALSAFSSDLDLVVIAAFAAVAHLTLSGAAVSTIAALHSAQATLAGLRRGIAFRTAAALDLAGRASTAAFCARGTLLLGEPEVTSVEPLAGFEAERVLALLAGAESGASHPTAVAILRAARARGIRPDGARSPTHLAGLGVTAVASSGEPLVVGSRALMLEQRISVAAAETAITQLEAQGRTVILVGLGGHLVGVVGLQDGLRPGARAAVQYLLDAGVEPVLLSGDARETCEALGRAVDIDHVRPEVLPAERGDEVRRLADGGATVAVLGRSPADDVALTAADVSVALGSAGASSGEWLVQLASTDVRDAAYALRLASRYRSEARLGLALAVGPGASLALTMAVGLAPPWSVPVACLIGAALAVIRLRSRL